jgi:hypothetical protein
MDVSELQIGSITFGSTTAPASKPTTLIGAISSDLIIRPDYKRSGQCFRCGSHDHRVKDCHKPSSGSGSGSGSSSGYGKWVIPAVNNDDSGMDRSGKRTTVAAVNDGDYSDSDGSGGGDIDWKTGIMTGAWK